MNRVQLYGMLGSIGCGALIPVGVWLGDTVGQPQLGKLCLAVGVIGLLVSLLVFALGRMTAK